MSEVEGSRAAPATDAASPITAESHGAAAAGDRKPFTLAQAFACAGAGVAHVVRTQRNMKIHLAVAALAVALGFALRISALSWLAVIVCIALVIAMECVNTALEAVVDLASPGYSELARVAKDCAAGAVLACAVGSVAVGAVVFLPPLAALLAG